MVYFVPAPEERYCMIRVIMNFEDNVSQDCYPGILKFFNGNSWGIGLCIDHSSNRQHTKTSHQCIRNKLSFNELVSIDISILSIHQKT